MNDESLSDPDKGQKSEPEERKIVKAGDENVEVRRGGGSAAGEAGKTQISGTSPGGSSDEGRPLVYGHYAEHWWEDACGEVPAAGDAPAVRHAVRRQVVFAVCALESWFFEWVRDGLLGSAVESARLLDDAPRSLPDRIKCVLCELHARGELATEPGFGESTAWDDLHDLLEIRNGLVHALASLPRGSVPPDAPTASPTPEDLRSLASDRPLWIVRGVADLLTGFAEAEPPDWMEVP